MGIADIAQEQASRRMDPAGNNRQSRRSTTLNNLRDRTNRSGQTEMAFGDFGQGPSIRVQLSVEELLKLILYGVALADVMLFIILLGVV